MAVDSASDPTENLPSMPVLNLSSKTLARAQEKTKTIYQNRRTTKGILHKSRGVDMRTIVNAELKMVEIS
jgi:hypothetical protein